MVKDDFCVTIKPKKVTSETLVIGDGETITYKGVDCFVKKSYLKWKKTGDQFYHLAVIPVMIGHDIGAGCGCMVQIQSNDAEITDLKG